MKTWLIHFFGGFTEEDIEERIKSIKEKADREISEAKLYAEDRISTITKIAESKIQLANKNAAELYEKGKMLGQYRAAAYFIAYAKSLYGRKDWSEKMFSKMTEFLNNVETNENNL